LVDEFALSSRQGSDRSFPVFSDPDGIGGVDAGGGVGLVASWIKNPTSA
jgi:hypothetical protein